MKNLPLTPEIKEKITKSLQKVSLFKDLNQEFQEQIIAHSKILVFDPGEIVVKQGEPSNECYILLKGHCSIVVQQNESEPAIEISTIGPSDCIGEMGLLLDQNRSATVIASDQVLALCFYRSTFVELAQKQAAFSFAISRVLAARLAKSHRQIPAAQLTQLPSAEVVSMLPFPFIQRHRVLPLDTTENSITIGFVDKMNPNLIGRIKNFLPSMELKAASIESDFFDKALARFSGLQEESKTTNSNQTKPLHPRLKELLERAVGEGVSDIHLSAGRTPRWRIDGKMSEIEDMSILDTEEAYDLVRSQMREDLIVQFENNSDADFAISLADVARFRVNLFRDNHGAGGVFRQIPAKILTAGQLGLPGAVLELANLPKGLILVTGATGSGKSTTLAAMIDYINRNKDEHIITLEDPIEFVHKSHKCLVNQREIGTHTNGFNAALRAALRQDPDIVLVGELRDLETIELALEVANTGHLVLGTLHTATAVSTIDRIINIYPADQQNQIRSSLADVLKGVISQTLCRKKGGGRVAAIEILLINTAAANLIRKSNTPQLPTFMQTGKGRGNRMLNDALSQLVRKGVVDYEEALSKSLDKEDLAKRCGRKFVYAQ